MILTRHISQLRNTRWLLQRYLDKHDWNELLQKMFVLLTGIHRRFINRLTFSRILFGWRNTLLSHVPVRVRLGKYTLYLIPCGMEAFHSWAHFRTDRQGIEFVVNYLQQNMVFLEIGSNAGLCSLAAAKKSSEVGNSIHVYAFEPIPSNYELLKSNLRMNGAEPIVVPVHTALGSVEGTATLYANVQRSDGLNVLTCPNLMDVDVVGEVQIPVTSLDIWLDRQRVKRVDLVKINAGCADVFVLQGAQKLLEQSQAPLILFESDPDKAATFGYHPVEVFWLLEQLGYCIYCLHKEGISPRPPRCYSGTMVAAKPFHNIFLLNDGLSYR